MCQHRDAYAGTLRIVRIRTKGHLHLLSPGAPADGHRHGIAWLIGGGRRNQVSGRLDRGIPDLDHDIPGHQVTARQASFQEVLYLRALPTDRHRISRRPQRHHLGNRLALIHHLGRHARVL